MTRRRARLLLVLASIVLAIGVSEVALDRMGGVFHDNFSRPDDERGWSLRPGFSGWLNGERVMRMSINSDGLRDREHPLAPPPRTLRVAVLGDSYMQGLNVPPDKMFTAFLERRLAQCLAPAGVQAEVLNFGVSGYSTGQEWLTYLHSARKYRPDLVLVAVYTNNDIFSNHRQLNPTDYPEQSPYFTLAGDTLVLDASFRDVLAANANQPWWRYWRSVAVEHSRVAQLLYQVRQGIPINLVASDGRADMPPGPEPSEVEDAIYRPPAIPEIAEAWRVTEALLLQLARDVRTDGAEPWVVTLANGIQVDADPDARRQFLETLGIESLFYPDHRIRDFAIRHGIPSMALAEPLSDFVLKTKAQIRGGYRKEVPLGTGHWNEQGNEVAAGLLGDHMCQASDAIARRRAP
jgi:lysophospholipase L1-like esterase